MSDRYIFRELSYAKPLSQFVGGADMMTPINKLQKISDEADLLGNFIKPVDALDPDLKRREAKMNYYKGKLDEISGYTSPHDQLRATRKLAQSYTDEMHQGELGTIAANYASFNKFKEEEYKRFKEGKISEEDYKTSLGMAIKDYEKQGGIGDRGIDGRYKGFSSVYSPDNVKDLRLQADEIIKNTKADLKTTQGWQEDAQGGLYRKVGNKVEKITYQQLFDDAYNSLYRNESNVKRLDWEAKRDLFNGKGSGAFDTPIKGEGIYKTENGYVDNNGYPVDRNGNLLGPGGTPVTVATMMNYGTEDKNELYRRMYIQDKLFNASHEAAKAGSYSKNESISDIKFMPEYMFNMKNGMNPDGSPLNPQTLFTSKYNNTEVPYNPLDKEDFSLQGESGFQKYMKKRGWDYQSSTAGGVFYKGEGRALEGETLTNKELESYRAEFDKLPKGDLGEYEQMKEAAKTNPLLKVAFDEEVKARTKNGKVGVKGIADAVLAKYNSMGQVISQKYDELLATDKNYDEAVFYQLFGDRNDASINLGTNLTIDSKDGSKNNIALGDLNYNGKTLKEWQASGNIEKIKEFKQLLSSPKYTYPFASKGGYTFNYGDKSYRVEPLTKEQKIENEAVYELNRPIYNGSKESKRVQLPLLNAHLSKIQKSDVKYEYKTVSKPRYEGNNFIGFDSRIVAFNKEGKPVDMETGKVETSKDPFDWSYYPLDQYNQDFKVHTDKIDPFNAKGTSTVGGKQFNRTKSEESYEESTTEE